MLKFRVKSEIVVLSIIVVIYYFTILTDETFGLNSPAIYQGDSTRYEKAAQDLYIAWINPEKFTNTFQEPFAYPILYLPLAPNGEKSLFVYAVSLTKLLLHWFKPELVSHALLVLNQISIIGIAILCWYLVRRVAGKLAGILIFILVLTNFSLWFYAKDGYYIDFGIFLFLLGITISGRLTSLKNSFLGSLCNFFAFFASPQVILPTLIWYFIGLAHLFVFSKTKFSKSRRICLFIFFSFILSLSTSHFIWLLQLQAGFSPGNAIELLFWQSKQAQTWAGKLPHSPLFFLEYAIFHFGWLLSILLCLPIIKGVVHYYRTWNFQKNINTLPLNIQTLLTAIIYVLIASLLKLPTIGRIHTLTLVLVLISSICCLNFDKFSTRLKSFLSYSKLQHAVICLYVIVGISQFYYHWNNYKQPDVPATFEKRLLASTHTNKIIKSEQISDQSLQDSIFLNDLSTSIVRINVGDKFGHSSFTDCGIEIAVAQAIDKGLSPLTSIEDRSSYELCFANEYRYYGLCQKKWKNLFPEYQFLNYLQPRMYYYFSGKSIVSYLSTRQKLVSCPIKESYSPPGSIRLMIKP